MADNLAPSNSLIAGRFAVDPSHQMPDAGGGMPCYLARDRQAADAERVALMVSRNASPRIRALEVLVDPVDNLMTPLGHGVGPAPGGKGEAYYIICSPAPGPPLSASPQRWPERALIEHVLRPAARVLGVLQGLGLTHRSIRPNNVFQSAPGQPVTLGAAWAAPPAMHQPTVFEPPYNAICHPAARGDGTIADDVYSLGVLLLTLAGGAVPLDGQDSAAVIRAKLEFGSLPALVRDLQLSGFLSDLLRGMLAEEAEHRPSPSLLLDPGAARARRVAARPARSSQRPLVVSDIAAFEARTLAYALSRDEKKAVQALRGDLVTTWLRRGLGDAALASAIEELVRERTTQTRPGPRSDATLVMRAITVLNPRMPLCWRGVSLWADGLDGLLTEGVASNSEVKLIVEELMVNNIVESWAAMQSGQDGKAPRAISRETSDQRRLLQASGPGGMLRMFYTRHPMLPCRVPTFANGWILTMSDLMVALEKTIGGTKDNLLDWHLAAFIAARADNQTSGQVMTLMGRADPDAIRLGELGLLRDLQVRHHARPLPALGKWVAGRVRPEVEKWHNRPKRAAITGALDALAQAGQLADILELVLDPAGRLEDERGAQRAIADLAFVEAQLRSIDDDDHLRFENIEQFGHAVTGALGLMVLIVTVMSLVSQ